MQTPHPLGMYLMINNVLAEPTLAEVMARIQQGPAEGRKKWRRAQSLFSDEASFAPEIRSQAFCIQGSVSPACLCLIVLAIFVPTIVP